MKLKSLTKIHQGKFLTYYVGSFELSNGGIKEYEFISRDPNLTVDSFGHNKCAGVGMVSFNVGKTKVLLQKELMQVLLLVKLPEQQVQTVVAVRILLRAE